MAPPTFRPEVRQITQFGVETVPGTLVAANKRFFSVMCDVDPKKPTNAVRQAGNLYSVNMAPGKGHTEIGLKADAAAVDDLVYLFSSLLSVPVFTTPGGGTLSRLATFTPDSLALNTKKTLSIQKGTAGSTNAKKIAYGQVMDLDLNFTPEKPTTLTGKMWGQQTLYGQTLTATPTTLAGNVLFGLSVDVYIATTEAGLGAGLVYPLTCNFKANKYLQDVYTLNSANTSYDGLVEVAPTLEYDFVFPDDSVAEAFVGSIDTSSIYYVEIINRGALIEGSLYNQVRLRSPIKFSDPGESTTQDVHTISLKGIAQDLRDFNTTGGALLVECQTQLTAL